MLFDRLDRSSHCRTRISSYETLLAPTQLEHLALKLRPNSHSVVGNLASWHALNLFVLQHSVYDPSTICFPQRDFAIGIAVAGLILMLIVICAILCLVNIGDLNSKALSKV